jgi:hypothetical protein
MLATLPTPLHGSLATEMDTLDIDVDAYVTARRLLVWLLDVQRHAESQGEPQPVCADQESHHVPHPRPPVPENTAAAASAKETSPTGSQGADRPRREDDANALQPIMRGMNTASAEVVNRNTLAHTTYPSQSTAVEQSSPDASPSSKKGWWQLRLPFRSSTTSTSLNARRRTTADGGASHTFSTAPAQDPEDGDVRRWKATVYSILRRQSSAFEDVVRELLAAHVEAGLTAAAAAATSTTAMETAGLCADSSGQATTAAASSLPSACPLPLPHICAHQQDPCVSNVEAKATRGSAEETERVARSDAQTAGDCPPTTTTTAAGLLSGLSHDFPPYLRVVSTGCAMTVLVQGEEGRKADQTGGLQGEPRLQGCAMPGSHKSGKLSRRKARATPLTLQEQLSECVKAPVKTRNARKIAVPVGEAGGTCDDDEGILALLSQLHQVQSASFLGRTASENPFYAHARLPSTAGGPSSSPPLTAVHRARTAALNASDRTVARSTVWEYVPLRTSFAQHAVLSSAEEEQHGASVHQRGSSTGSKTSRGGHSTLKSAWWRRSRGGLRRRRVCSCEEGHVVPLQHMRAADADRSHSQGKECFVAAALNVERAVCAADLLCAMSDGKWDAMQADIRASQQLVSHIATAFQHDDGAAPRLCAFCPADGCRVSASTCREQMLFSYSLPPCELRAPFSAAVLAATPSSSSGKSTQMLALHTSWAVCVEVDAAYAAWLRQTLLAVSAAAPCPAVQDAGDDVTKLRAQVLTALEHLASASA